MKQKPNLLKGKRIVKRSKKMDVDGTMEVHLQEEIIMDILSRLPVLSLLRFKCVSKYWMTLISEPYFTLKHLNHAKNNQNSQKILVLHGEFALHCSSLSSASLSSVRLAEDVRKLDWPSNPRPWSDDYKILKIDDTAHCEILTLKSGSWRKIDKRPAGVFPVLSDTDKRPAGVFPVLSDTEDSLAFVHGAFHWLDSSLEKTLISFSISNDMYGEIPLPEGMSLVFNMNRINGASALEGMLCVYSTHIRRGSTHSNGEVLLRCRDLECGSVFKISKESSRLWPQSVSEPLQDGFVYTERKRVMKHSEINKMDVHGTMEILSRLPVRSLVRFKCVSKFWMALISEPYFTLKHLNHAKNDQNSQRFLVNQWSSLYCSSLSSVQRVEEVQKLDCPSNTELWRCFLYCCYDSLALIGVYNYCDHTHQLWLWNPSTRESIVLPGPKFPLELFCTWGLGYDSVSDDYKILKIDLKSRSKKVDPGD
ncbi:hypothetical protein T459_31598 [Capsicum annuum]|uniref:F-box domain-containing protein n=1 Tax=Capsicum annuum TaxID=4072 RepID=A0A2G2YBQ0_CAPAN|nr:hypothetical protein T459_31598 [Capsicum annuum]